MTISKRAQGLAPSIIREMSGRRRPTSIDLSLGQPSLDPDVSVMRAAVDAMFAAPQGYTENAGLLALREAIARYHGVPGRDRRENVIVTVGSEEAVYVAALSVLDPGDELLFPEPGYPAYPGIAALAGAVPRPFAVERATGLCARAKAIEAAITEKTRALVLNSPANPFGTIDGEDELRAIAALCESRGITIISDEVYRELYYGDATPPSVASFSRSAIVCGGLSKSCAMTGHRLGWMIGDAELVKKATLVHQLVVTCGPRLAQLAALEVFKEPARLRAHVPHYAEARRAVIEASSSLPPEAGLHLGDGAFYAILDVSAWARGNPLQLALELLEQEDVVVVPGNAFGAGGEWFWRLSYAAGPTSAGEGTRRIARFLTKRKAG